MVCTITSTGEEILQDCKNEYEPPLADIKEKLREIIWGLYCNGYDSFYLNCEYGIPLWSAEIICALKKYNDIELNIVMPYEEQANDWYEDQRERYFSVHSLADDVYMLTKQYYDDCYDDTEEYMIDQSDLLLVFGCKQTGDFLHSIKYARENDVECMYIKIF